MLITTSVAAHIGFPAHVLPEYLKRRGVPPTAMLLETAGRSSEQSMDAVAALAREPRDAARCMKDKIRQAIGGTLLIDCSGALVSAGQSPDVNRTPPTSDLCRICGETIFRTRR